MTHHKKKSKTDLLRRIFFIILGACLVSLSIESFLVPNNIIDGGIVGISIMLAHLTGWKLGVFLFILNIPFFIIGYKEIGKTFALSTVLGVTALSVSTFYFHGIDNVTDDLLLASVFGGVILGIGVGLVIRNGGSLDGTEIVAILINEKISFSVGEIVMFFNLFILGASGFVFGWENAMYSLITYFIAFKMIDLTVEGFEESKKAIIISEMSEEIGEAIQDRLGRNVTYVYGKGGYSKKDIQLVYCILTRLEEAKLKSIVSDIDDEAFIEISTVSDVKGGKFKKKQIH